MRIYKKERIGKVTTLDEFLVKLFNQNKHYREGVFTLIGGDFVDVSTNILVKDKYGICATRPKYLLDGFKPSIRSAVDSTAYFINLSKERHGEDCFNYDNTTYQATAKKLTITCKEHGDFVVRANQHIAGSKCPMCISEYQQGGLFIKPTKVLNNKGTYSKMYTNFYVVELWNDYERFFKVGVTNNIKKRIRPLAAKYNLKVIAEFPMDVYSAILSEKTILEDFKNISFTPSIKFEGHTECLSENPLEYYYYYYNLQLKENQELCEYLVK